MKYNRPGGRVVVRTSATSDGGAQLVVANTGPVIDPDEVERLFEPFHRAEGARTESAGSCGLGLSIVRSIVRAHGGSINTSTRPEGGLEVLVTLAPSARPGAGDHGPAPSRSCSISSS